MKNHRRMALVTVATVALLAVVIGRELFAQRASSGNAAVRAAIEAGNKKFLDGAAKRDAALIASAYTENAEAFPPNSDVVKGRPALQKLWQSVLDSGIAAFDLNTTEVEADGNLA